LAAKIRRLIEDLPKIRATFALQPLKLPRSQGVLITQNRKSRKIERKKVEKLGGQIIK
jgi:hypothetical protein